MVLRYLRLSLVQHEYRQLEAELDISYRTLHQRIERFARALNAPSLSLSGSVEIDEVYVTAGKKGHERDGPSRSRGLSTRGRGSYEGDKPPVFILVDRRTGQRHVVLVKSADEPTVRFLLAGREEESLTVYTDGFHAYDPLDDTTIGSTANRPSTATVNTLLETCTSTAARATGRCCARGSRPIEVSRRTN